MAPTKITNTATPRDPRLDFFRGLAMFIIFIAHTPRDAWALWIPARFGFSDATEIFVCCSGMASAIAFGKIFHDRGWLIGAARIIHRVWQVYWAHIALFFVIAGMLVLFDAWLEPPNDKPRSYVGRLNLFPFFKNTQDNLVGLLTLTYVPNYFDILPMYLVILALIPIMMAAVRVNQYLPFALMAALWLAANFQILALPAEPWSNREWFFNPFGWQLVFFTGFAFMAGWLKPPPVNRWLIGLCLVGVIVTIPFAWYLFRNEVHALRDTFPFLPDLREIYKELKPYRTKTDFGILRYLHFLMLAYLAWVLVGEKGHRLISDGIWGKIVKVIQKVGQQSLAVFVSSLVFAQIGGAILDHTRPHFLALPLVNIGGFACLIAVAYTVAWYKSTPWKRRQAKPQSPSPQETQPMGSTIIS